MCALFDVLLLVLDLVYWVLIAAAIMSWLTAFGVVNRHNHAVAMIDDMLYRVTEPMLRPLRRVIPPLGGVDISFIILIILIYFAKDVIIRYAACYY
jgi:YggT family protein